jgi:hypothetical protein
MKTLKAGIRQTEDEMTKGQVKVTELEPFVTSIPTEILVCDPCYLFCNETQDEHWQDFCRIMYPYEAPHGHDAGPYGPEGVLHFQGAKVHYMGTAHGDGCYELSYRGPHHGGNCGVDAGMLCVVTLDDAKKINEKLAMECRNSSICVYIPEFKGAIYLDGEEEFKISGSNGLLLETDPEPECPNCGDTVSYEGERCWSCELDYDEDEDW